jgi:hypothetical protein
MTKHIELKRFNQGTALTTGTLALPPLVIEGLAEFNGSFDRLCLKAGTAAIEAMLAADAEQFCGKRYQRHADRQGYRWGMIGSEVGWHGGKAAMRPRWRPSDTSAAATMTVDGESHAGAQTVNGALRVKMHDKHETSATAAAASSLIFLASTIVTSNLLQGQYGRLLRALAERQDLTE